MNLKEMHALGSALILLLGACGSMSDASTEPPSGRQLLEVALQASDSCVAGQLFADSLRVYIIDGMARPLSGIPITFTVYAGGGSVSPAVVNSNKLGNAAASFRCGTDVSVAEDIVQATAPGITNTAPTFRIPVKPGP